MNPKVWKSQGCCISVPSDPAGSDADHVFPMTDMQAHLVHLHVYSWLATQANPDRLKTLSTHMSIQEH